MSEAVTDSIQAVIRHMANRFIQKLMDDGWSLNGVQQERLASAFYEIVKEESPLLITHPNDAKYEELLMAVARKFPNESRHETALRYITEAESRDYGTASEVCKQSSEGE